MERKQRIREVIVVLIVVIVTGLLSYLQVFYSLDKAASDALCQKESVTNKNIYVIGIDDKTLEQYGPINTWSRDVSANLVEQLTKDESASPAVIAFDVIYSEQVDETADNHFAQVCQDAGNVVLAMTYNFKEQPVTGADGKVTYDPFYVDSAVQPYDTLRESTTTGFANTIIDPDGYVRETMAYVDYEGEQSLSFTSQIYKAYMESQGKEAVMPGMYDNNRYFFSYSGKSGCYNTVSMADVLDGTVDAKMFANSIVFVGAYAVGMQDAFTPAISHDEQMYGVEVHANIVEALLEGRTQLPFSNVIYAVVLAILAGVFYVVNRRWKISISTIVTIALVIVNIIFAKVMYGQGYIVPVVVAPVVFVIIYLEGLIQGYIAEILRRKRVVDVFKKYVSPQVVDKISKKKDFEIVLGGENRHIAVLFVDIRGFTTMSESLQPEEVVEILNEYLSLTTKSIFDNGGTLDKFVGDATMAVFNAPFDLDDYIYRAVHTAWDMKLGADAIEEKFTAKYGKSVAFGIGVNCGPAVVGNIGCDFRMDYTAIGDTVNTAARLESNAKRGQILISQDVLDAVKDKVEVTPIGEIPLKGKSKGVFVYQVDEVR